MIVIVASGGIVHNLICPFRADGSNEECGISNDGAECSGLLSGASSVMKSSPGESSHDVDKQERIERYVRMTIQNHAESRLAKNDPDSVRK